MKMVEGMVVMNDEEDGSGDEGDMSNIVEFEYLIKSLVFSY